MPPKKGGKTQKAAENNNNSGNNEGRSKAEQAKKKKGPATKKVSKKGTIGLCLEEKASLSKEELPGNRVILKCVGTVKGFSAANASVGFSGKKVGGVSALNAPDEAFVEYHLCKGMPGKKPKVASRVGIPKGRALYRCYTKGASLEEVEKKAREEFREEESSPESQYTKSTGSASPKSSAPPAKNEEENENNAGIVENGPASRTRSRTYSNESVTKLMRAATRRAFSPHRANRLRRVIPMSLKNLVALTRRVRKASPRPPSPGKKAEAVALKHAEAAVRATSERFLAVGSVKAKKAAFNALARELAEAAAAGKARSPMPSLKKGASGP